MAKSRDLKRAKRGHRQLQSADLDGADLEGVDLSNVDLEDADLSYANLQNANLRNANLKNANLRNANLNKADLSGADLQDAILCDSKISGANFYGVHLTGATFSSPLSELKMDQGTILKAVQCKFIYVESLWDEYRLPRDPNQDFEPGEFAMRIRLGTLDEGSTWIPGR